MLIETILGKERVLEVHLNIAEFGPGIFGVSAESYAYSPPSKINRREAID